MKTRQITSFEFTTYLPAIDTANSQFSIVCDGSGNPVGVYKQNWKLYNYNFNLTVFEERYNVVLFDNGMVGLRYTR